MKKKITKPNFLILIAILMLGTLSLVAQPTHPNQTGLAGVGIDRENLPSSTQLIFTRADDGRVITDLKFESQVKIDGTVGLVFKRCWFRSNGGIAAIRDKYGPDPRNTTFEDCDFGAHGYDQWASSANILNMAGTTHFRRCLIYNSADGIKFNNMSVNYLEDCWLQPVLRGDKHTDCSQLNDNNVAEIYYTRCTFEKRTWTFNGVVAHSQEELNHPNATLAETTDWGNACLQTKPCGTSGGCTDIIPGAYYSFENCILIGGNYIITAEDQPGRFVNNILIRGSSHTAASSLRNVSNFDDISGNIFHDDGAPFTSGNLGQDSNPTPIPFLDIIGLNNDIPEAPAIPTNLINITSSNNDPVDEAEVMDGDYTTRWASSGDGKWIAFEFNTTYNIDAIGIAFYKGDERSAFFDIQVSDDGTSWTTIYSGTSSGTTLDLELFDLPNTEGSHLRYLGHGNSTSSWNAINELVIYGTIEITSTGIWQNFPASAQTGAFTVEYDAVPNGNNVDALTGIQNGNASVYDDVACIIRFNSGGQIDARNGGSYSSINIVNYSQGTTYHFRVEIDVPSHIYNVFVTPEGQSEITLATGFAFRTAQQSVTELNRWSVYAYVPSHTVSNMTFQTNSAKSLEANKSVQGQKSAPYLFVYPNPASNNQCTIHFNGFANDENVRLHIFDMSGRIVYQTQVSTSDQGSYILDISSQGFKNKGIYILSAESQSVQKNIKLVVK